MRVATEANTGVRWILNLISTSQPFLFTSFISRTLAPIMSTDKELYKLELLSLVTRVSQELFNHTKLQDKNLAEFVIAVSYAH